MHLIKFASRMKKEQSPCLSSVVEEGKLEVEESWG